MLISALKNYTMVSHKKVEPELLESVTRLRQAQRIAHLGFWDWDFVNNHMFFSDELCSLFGITQEELGTTDFETVQKRLFHPDDYDRVMKHVESAIRNNTPFKIRHRIARPDGEVRYIHVQGEVIRDEGGTPTQLIGTVMDITDYKQTEMELRCYEHIINATDEFMSYIDSSYIYRAVNQRYLDAFQKSRDELIGHSVAEILGEDIFEKTVKHNLDRCLGGESIHYREWFSFPGPGEIYQDLHYSPHRDMGKVLGVFVNARDITAQEHTEEQLRASVQEKNLLLKEIHHRVKNNLQIICSLLHLQSSLIKNAELLRQFKECETRIKTIALVHEKLHESTSLQFIHADEYLESLIGNLTSLYRTRLNSAQVTIYCEPIRLDVDLAFYCGLIFNELISNALQHAFPENEEKNKLNISFNKNDDDGMVLIVEDNGIGFSSEDNSMHKNPIGLGLVKMFVEQLNGSLQIISDNGTAFRITLPGPDLIM